MLFLVTAGCTVSVGEQASPRAGASGGAVVERSRASMQGGGEQRSQRGREPTGGERASVTNTSKQAGTREEVSRRAGGEIRRGAGGAKKILSTPPLMRRDEGQGPNECKIIRGTPTHTRKMIELEPLAVTALTSFFSTFASFSVCMYFWCPNRRCCQSERIRTACEGDKKAYEAQKRNRFSED